MFGHSTITAVWMLFAGLWCWLLGDWFTGPLAFASFITGVWWSREQYWDEIKLRKVGRDSWRDVLWTMLMILRPMERNLDLFTPVAVAWIMAAVYMLGGAL